MESVQHHSAAVLVVPQNTDRKALVGVYDSTYPVEVFREHYNFLGGNGCDDRSPRLLVTREIGNEFMLGSESESVGQIIGSATADVKATDYIEGRKYAPAQLRKAIKDAILGGLEGTQDYKVSVEGSHVGRDDDLVYLSSIFVSRIADELLEEAASELAQDRQLTDEGFTRIVTPENVTGEGGIRGSWGYATIIKNITGWQVTEHSFIEVTPFGTKPRDSFQDYKSEFKYNRDPEVDWRKK